MAEEAVDGRRTNGEFPVRSSILTARFFGRNLLSGCQTAQGSPPESKFPPRVTRGRSWYIKEKIMSKTESINWIQAACTLQGAPGGAL